MPKRIQLKRTKGWRMPKNTLKVDRSTRYGNPFSVDRFGRERAIQLFELWFTGVWDKDMSGVVDASVEPADREDKLTKLRGKNLACWCKPGESCHADILLKLANEGD